MAGDLAAILKRGKGCEETNSTSSTSVLCAMVQRKTQGLRMLLCTKAEMSVYELSSELTWDYSGFADWHHWRMTSGA